MRAWSPVKNEIAPPVHNIVVLNLSFSFKYAPKISCFPPAIFVNIKSGFTFFKIFRSFLS